MEILNNFGFEPAFFIAQIINFLILAYVFKRFLYKPILKVLHDRQKKISQGIENANTAEKLLANAKNQEEKIVKTAGLEAEKILAQTKKTAEELREQILSDARENAEKIVKESKKQAQLEMDGMIRVAKEASLDISERILDTLLSTMFTKEEKEKILKRNLEKMNKYGKS